MTFQACQEIQQQMLGGGGYCRDLPRIKLHFGAFLGTESDNKGATFTYVTDFLHTKAITGHDMMQTSIVKTFKALVMACCGP